MSAEVTARFKFDTAAFREAVDGAGAKWKKFSKTLKAEGEAAAKILAPVAKTVRRIGIAAGGTAAAGAGFMAFLLKDGIALNSQMEAATATFEAFTKDAVLARQIVADIKKEADITPFDTNEMITAGKALISSAQGSREELMKLIKTAEVLAALNPAQGLEGAAFALREAMGGNMLSLQSRFDMSRNLIAELKAQGKDGLDLVNAALEKMGAGPELVKGLAHSYEGLKSNAGAFFDQMKQTAAEPLFQTLKSELASFVQYMDGGANDSVQDFAKAFGENFNEGVKDVFAVIKSIEWKEMADVGKAFAMFMGKAASAVAALMASLPDTLATLGNAADTVGLWGSKAYAAISWGDERKGALQNAADLEARIAGRKEAKAARDAAQNKAAEDQRNAPLKTSEVVDNWLKTRGKTRADMAKDKELQAEMQARFAGLMVLDKEGSDFSTNVLPKYGRPAPPTAPTVKVTMNQANPTHTVMAT